MEIVNHINFDFEAEKKKELKDLYDTAAETMEQCRELCDKLAFFIFM